MHQYLDLLNEVLAHGHSVDDRTGVGTQELFGLNFLHDMRLGFPLLTTKRVFFNGVKDELLWFLSGSTNVNDLPERSRQLWSPWAREDGELGPTYGAQWRHAAGKDQIAKAIWDIKHDPLSRRIIVNAWNVEQVPMMELPPCHTMFQFHVSGKYLDLMWHQRSVDVFLGLPFNIASYGLLLSMVAQVTGLRPGLLIGAFGSVHIYNNHREQVMIQRQRTPGMLPTLKLDKSITCIDAFKDEHIQIMDYAPQSVLKGEVAV